MAMRTSVSWFIGLTSAPQRELVHSGENCWAMQSSVPATHTDRPLSWPIPARLVVDDVATRGVVYVGDAAGLADPLTGEGIGQALLSARIASLCIEKEVGNLDAVAERYATSISDRFLADHLLSKNLSQALTHGRAVHAALLGIPRIPGAKSLFAKWMFEEIPRSELVPLYRLVARVRP